LWPCLLISVLQFSVYHIGDDRLPDCGLTPKICILFWIPPKNPVDRYLHRRTDDGQSTLSRARGIVNHWKAGCDAGFFDRDFRLVGFSSWMIRLR
jgi:hypothetical protein